MPRMSMVEAIRDAMDCKMAEYERVDDVIVASFLDPATDAFRGFAPRVPTSAGTITTSSTPGNTAFSICTSGIRCSGRNAGRPRPPRPPRPSIAAWNSASLIPLIVSRLPRRMITAASIVPRLTSVLLRSRRIPVTGDPCRPAAPPPPRLRRGPGKQHGCSIDVA